jgi:hypothetical protein
MRSRPPAAGLLCGLAALLLPAAAGARPASRGLFTEAGVGATGVVGAHRADAAIGPLLVVRLGYDLAGWLSLGVQLGASSHEATVPPPPRGEWFQLYRGQADARLGVRAGALVVFVEGGAGGAYLSTNVLDRVGVTEPGRPFSLAINAGGGLEYQIRNRHYALGLAGDGWLLPGFDALTGVDVRLYLRYTY